MFYPKVHQFCMLIPAGYQQVITSHLASGSSSFPEATATQNSTCRLERSSEKKQRTARPERVKERKKAKDEAPQPTFHT